MKKYLPSVLTIGNICCGFMAVAIGDIYLGSIFLLIGFFLDAFDGMLARAFNAQSEMGKELDSLADMISFGLAPAYLYSLISPMNHWISFLAPMMFVVGAAIRLARFNSLPSLTYFRGLPTPAASLFLVGIFIGVQFNKGFFIDSLSSSIVYFMIPFILMSLMISKIRMFSIKSIHEGWSGNYMPIICFSIFILLVILDFSIAFSSIVIVYILLSLLEGVLIRR